MAKKTGAGDGVLRQAANVPSRGLIAGRRTVQLVCKGWHRDDPPERAFLVAVVPSFFPGDKITDKVAVTVPTAKAAARARTKLRQDPAWLDFLDDLSMRDPADCRIVRTQRKLGPGESR